ncbi:MAG TPA: zf-HC2 domain-containing protein [Thermoanaerobaculia bacterium]|nr:zf-HC2 domain-containing protein [Thermoanaerobaculia bacterium]
MIEIESRLTGVAKGWIDQEGRALSGHPDAATWERYGSGELPPGEIESLRDHLVTCRECRKLVLAGPKAGATIVPEREAAMASADAEERRAWHSLRRQVDETTPPPAALRPPPATARKWMSWASPLVAVASLTVAGWTWYQANQPHIGVMIAEAVPAGQARGGTARGIEEGEGRPLALLVPLPDLAAGTPVRVEILDGTGAVEWRGESPATADGEYGIEIPPRFRRIPGCQVRLSVPAGEGEGTEGWKELGTFVVTAPPP